jgi:hypothetical protein
MMIYEIFFDQYFSIYMPIIYFMSIILPIFIIIGIFILNFNDRPGLFTKK